MVDKVSSNSNNNKPLDAPFCKSNKYGNANIESCNVTGGKGYRYVGFDYMCSRPSSNDKLTCYRMPGKGKSTSSQKVDILPPSPSPPKATRKIEKWKFSHTTGMFDASHKTKNDMKKSFYKSVRARYDCDDKKFAEHCKKFFKGKNE